MYKTEMAELLNKLPFELANICYSYMGKHPLAELVEEYWIEKEEENNCSDCGNEIIDYNYDGLCECCYLVANPHLECGIGRDCNICGNELQMYRWCKIYGNNGGEYCMTCYNNLEEDE